MSTLFDNETYAALLRASGNLQGALMATASSAAHQVFKRRFRPTRLSPTSSSRSTTMR